MAITLVTGLPGHGKTLYTLARYKEEAEKDQRPVFHNGIKDLNIPGWQEWDVNNWQDLPAGALLIVDECQFIFPVRGRGQPPEFIEKLATHRHLGIDFVIITQNPMLIDPFVRRLIDRHFHVVRKFGTHFATIHEFANGCRDNVHNNRKDSIRHEWKYPKHVFEWYKSAEQHTVKRRIPARVFVLLAVPIVFAGLVFTAYHRLNPESQKERAEQQSGVTSKDPASVLLPKLNPNPRQLVRVTNAPRPPPPQTPPQTLMVLTVVLKLRQTAKRNRKKLFVKKTLPLRVVSLPAFPLLLVT